MATVILIFHIVVSLFLIFIVLIQGGKGAELGAAFGGSSQTLFGSRGAATFLNKLTTIVAVVFMVTSLLLAISATKGSSVIKKTLPAAQRSAPAPQPQGMPAPAAPAAPAPAGQQTAPAPGQQSK